MSNRELRLNSDSEARIEAALAELLQLQESGGDLGPVFSRNADIEPMLRRHLGLGEGLTAVATPRYDAMARRQARISMLAAVEQRRSGHLWPWLALFRGRRLFAISGFVLALGLGISGAAGAGLPVHPSDLVNWLPVERLPLIGSPSDDGNPSSSGSATPQAVDLPDFDLPATPWISETSTSDQPGATPELPTPAAPESPPPTTVPPTVAPPVVAPAISPAPSNQPPGPRPAPTVEVVGGVDPTWAPGQGGENPGNGGEDSGNGSENGVGQGGTPPGQGGDNPGNGGTPPGLDDANPGGGENPIEDPSGSPPGLSGDNPGNGGADNGNGSDNGLGQGGTPPGQSGDNPGNGGGNNGNGSDNGLGQGGTPPGQSGGNAGNGPQP